MIPQSMYVDIERQLMPMIRSKAARLRGFMDFEDAIQEARIVLFKALQRYDYKRQPDLARYVGVCLNNAFAGQYNKATSQRRMPRRPSRQSDGTFKMIPQPPSSLDDEVGLECGLLVNLDFDEVQSVVKEAESLLMERERTVLLCFVQPPHELSLEPGEPGFNLQVAEYLGITKNMIDWSIHLVRQALLKVMRLPEFKDGIGKLVSGPGWPYLNHSESWHDVDMVNGTINDRGLTKTICDETRQKVDNAERWSIVYDWGEVLFLRLGELSASLILVGRFNRLMGTLYGAKYGSQTIPVSWYQRCMKAINGA